MVETKTMKGASALLGLSWFTANWNFGLPAQVTVQNVL
jgi:hypothetical protein